MIEKSFQPLLNFVLISWTEYMYIQVNTCTLKVHYRKWNSHDLFNIADYTQAVDSVSVTTADIKDSVTHEMCCSQKYIGFTIWVKISRETT